MDNGIQIGENISFPEHIEFASSCSDIHLWVPGKHTRVYPDVLVHGANEGS